MYIFFIFYFFSLAQVELEGEFLTEPLCILDRWETNIQKRAITQVKVQWKHFSLEEATWEEEEFMRKAYPALFPEEEENTRDGVPHEGGICNTPKLHKVP